MQWGKVVNRFLSGLGRYESLGKLTTYSYALIRPRWRALHIFYVLIRPRWRALRVSYVLTRPRGRALRGSRVGMYVVDRIVDSGGVHCVVVIDVLYAGISRLRGMTLSAIYPGILSCGIVLSWRAGDGFHR